MVIHLVRSSSPGSPGFGATVGQSMVPTSSGMVINPSIGIYIYIYIGKMVFTDILHIYNISSIYIYISIGIYTDSQYRKGDNDIQWQWPSVCAHWCARTHCLFRTVWNVESPVTVDRQVNVGLFWNSDWLKEVLQTNLDLSSSNLTWQCKIHHLWLIFPLKTSTHSGLSSIWGWISRGICSVSLEALHVPSHFHRFRSADSQCLPLDGSWLRIHGGFHSHGGTPKWMACKGKSHENRWFRGDLHLWNPPVLQATASRSLVTLWSSATPLWWVGRQKRHPGTPRIKTAPGSARDLGQSG